MKTTLVPGGDTYEDVFTTDDLAAFARVSDPDANAVLESIAKGVLHHMERNLGRAIVQQDVEILIPLPDWAYGYGKNHWESIKLPLPPHVSVTSVHWREWDGTEYELGSTEYRADLGCDPGIIRFLGEGHLYPGTIQPSGKGHFRISYRAGYPAGDYPEGLLLVAKRLIATNYENPENTIAGIDESVLMLPPDLANTYELYRVIDFDIEWGE